ncbi:hypothetical protein [Streptosporangium pseudovulgare]|uniref:Uncharacterized protein n=1 Tax=Streptosporangium pseudovulgare TaxID=35765 RepID=A0ABQ2R4R4_9ACTN|nr:hypothetical protein [Streptosporangium pseudovulgare]GGQ12280.1 hypothetical protein GCM10010140_48200 [Streptosporangium pseudovulgare]
MNDRSAWLRPGLLALVAVSILGTGLELAAERHWQAWNQLPPWGALVLLTAGVVIAALRDSRWAVAVVWVLSVVVLAVAAIGVYLHVTADYDAGFLDQRYAATWESIPPLTRWWYAVSKTVGPAPPFASGALAQTAVVLLLATLVRRPGRGD